MEIVGGSGDQVVVGCDALIKMIANADGIAQASAAEEKAAKYSCPIDTCPGNHRAKGKDPISFHPKALLLHLDEWHTKPDEEKYNVSKFTEPLKTCLGNLRIASERRKAQPAAKRARREGPVTVMLAGDRLLAGHKVEVLADDESGTDTCDWFEAIVVAVDPAGDIKRGRLAAADHVKGSVKVRYVGRRGDVWIIPMPEKGGKKVPAGQHRMRWPVEEMAA